MKEKHRSKVWPVAAVYKLPVRYKCTQLTRPGILTRIKDLLVAPSKLAVYWIKTAVSKVGTGNLRGSFREGDHCSNSLWGANLGRDTCSVGDL